MSTACADEVVAPPGDGEATTCVGPAWTYEHDLGFTRWSDTGGAAAESGDVVLVVWQERLENQGGGDEVHGRFLDAATGEPRGDLTPLRTTSSQVWVRPVDDGFIVFVQSAFTILVFHVDVDGAGFVSVGAYPRGDLGFTAVSTDAGVVAFGQGEVLHFNHDGRPGEVQRDGVASETMCRTSTALPDGRVAAWCFDLRSGAQRWLTLDADGESAVATPLDGFLEWPPVMAATDDGVFVVLPIDEKEARVALFDHDGRQRVAPVAVPLRAAAGGNDDVMIMGVNACTASCEGLGLVARGNRALLDVMTIPGGAERFDVVVDNDTITMSTRGVREVASRHMLTATASSPLSMWTRFAPHLPILDAWPPQVLVVERPCLRTATDG